MAVATRKTPARRFLRRPDAAIIIGAVSVFVVFAVMNPVIWFSFFNIRNITSFTAILGLVAIGEALLILCREIDVSVGSVYGVVGIAFVSFEPGLGVTVALVAALLIGAAIGLLNGILVVRFGLSSLIVTLGALLFYRGLIYLTTGGTVRSFTSETESHPIVQLFGGNWLLGLENGFWWFLVTVGLFTYLLTRRRYGNQLLAIGGSSPSAASRGVRVSTVKLLAFVVCSFMAGFAGIVTLANEPRTNVNIGDGLELQVIAAAVTGGVLLTGGRGSVIGAAFGAFFLVAVRSELVAMGAPADFYISFVGFILVAAAILNISIQRRLGGVRVA